MRRALIALAGTLAATAVLPAPASADHHLMLIRELYPGSSDDSFIELQMYASGQNLMTGHHIVLYDTTGVATHNYTFPNDVASGQDQRTILIGDSNAAGSPDFTDAALNIPGGGGAACFVSEMYPDGPIDCVAWGTYLGSVDDVAVGTPAAPGGVSPGTSIVRRIDRECASRLDGDDDVNVSATDFLTGQTPSPRNNSVTPTETNCPDTTINNPKPANPTNSQSATFNFSSTPAGATFECKLDNEAGFTNCNGAPNTQTTKSYAGPLSGGSHTFQVRAVIGGVPDPSPASYTWMIDLTPPDTTMGTGPSGPTNDTTPTFSFTSEAGATFQCSIDTGVASFGSCLGAAGTHTPASPLAQGAYTFRVRATDTAGNPDPSPATRMFTVDTMGPTVDITGQPDDPSNVNTADFTYESAEPERLVVDTTYQCRLTPQGQTAPAFASCADAGKSYSGLTDGTYTFEVRATDQAGNQGSADSYAWEVDATDEPPPNTVIIKAPKKKGTKRVVKVEFTADPPTNATFTCQIDSKPPVPCSPPLFKTPKLKYGKHTITITATGPGGTELEPAVVSFKIVRP